MFEEKVALKKLNKIVLGMGVCPPSFGTNAFKSLFFNLP